VKVIQVSPAGTARHGRHATFVPVSILRLTPSVRLDYILPALVVVAAADHPTPLPAATTPATMDVSFPTEANGASGVVDFDTAAPALTGRRKKMTKKPKTGGFESMDLLPELYRAIKLKGYQLPTPVQRKTLPLALAGAVPPLLLLLLLPRCSPRRGAFVWSGVGVGVGRGVLRRGPAVGVSAPLRGMPNAAAVRQRRMDATCMEAGEAVALRVHRSP
jgi:hypothetical protein